MHPISAHALSGEFNPSSASKSACPDGRNFYNKAVRTGVSYQHVRPARVEFNRGTAVTITSSERGTPTVKREWFVVTPASEPELILDMFETSCWAPAILEYAERSRRGAYAVPVSLRQARPGEIEAMSLTETEIESMELMAAGV